jgi:signal transduction histidine kinase
VDDSISRHTRKRFFETLTAFADPFVEKKETTACLESEFEFSASTWKNGDKHVIVGASKQLSIDDLLILEHIIKGRIDSEGVFQGRVKSFGKWLDGEITIELNEKHVLGKRFDSRLGPFDIFLATYERDPKNTTHTNAEIAHIRNLAKMYSGFMVYRDGLRVMPYGRADNDFFEIEQRRSLHAGREFWNHRNMFGKVAISKWQNPNIRDKAGREGIVDNRASKSLKDIVSNILMDSSRRFFGTGSEKRMELLPGIQEANKAAKLELERKALNTKLRREFRSNLRRFLPELIEDYNQLRELENLVSNSSILSDEVTVLECRERLQNTNERIGRFRLGQSPKKLGTMEEDYLSFREAKNACQKMMSSIGITLSEAIDTLNPKSPKDIALADLQRQAQYINRRTGVWLREIKKIFESESLRIEGFVKSRNRILQDEFLPVVDDVEHGRVSLKVASNNIEKRREALDIENEEIFEPYISTIECLQERIDLTGLAGSISEEIADLREELNRLNELAQLGIAVEIAGHELETYDATIGDGLNRMPDNVKQSRAFLQLKASYVNMSDKLRYLAPLKLSGDRIQEWITGEYIHEYVSGFFDMQIKERKIDLIPSSDFLKFKIFDLPSRILPVFINLVNNSIYWVGQQEGVKVIRLSVEKGKIFVSDNGPGVSDLDIGSLFTLFFTKKIRDGRGVGLYLCRSNLAAGGHRIEYVSNPAEKIENGANFGITFKGAVYG